MFKEILHYTFKRPFRAFDISSFHHHGRATGVGFNADGEESGSGAMVFNGQSSRVQVPFGKAWQDLGAIKIEALVKIDELGTRHNLVEGLLSFALFVRADGVVTGSFLAPEEPDGSDVTASNSLTATVLDGGGSPDPFSTLTAIPPDPDQPGGDFSWKGVNSDTEFSPDGVKRTAAPGDWTRVTFIHNGFSLQLWLGNAMAGYRDDVTSGVLGVQPGGVHIGAWPNTDKYVLKGALDSVRIWKLDPIFRERRFFCRPMRGTEEACWRELLHKIVRQWRDPEVGPRVDKVLNCIHEAEQDLLRAIHGQGGEAVAQSGVFGQRYDRLWCNGRLDGPEMAEFLDDFGKWIQDTTGPAFDDFISKLISCRKELQALGLDESLKCIADRDVAWQAFGKLIGEHALPGLCTPPLGTVPLVPEKSYPSRPGY